MGKKYNLTEVLVDSNNFKASNALDHKDLISNNIYSLLKPAIAN